MIVRGWRERQPHFVKVILCELLSDQSCLTKSSSANFSSKFLPSIYSCIFLEKASVTLNISSIVGSFELIPEIPPSVNIASIKSVACHRKNSLFSFSAKGAEATMNLLSLIETAKANNAKPYFYLKYVMDKMAKAVYYNHPCNMEDLTPWADAYKQYESEQYLCPRSIGIPPGNQKPHTPKIKETA